MRRALMMSVVTSAVIVGGSAIAHHGWGSYDASKKMMIESSVSRLEWRNPHVLVAVNHDGGSWELVLAPPFRMGARGLNPNMIEAGTPVRAEGYPSTRVEREMRAERIVVGGRTFELR